MLYTAKTYAVKDVVEGMEYEFRVSAINISGSGEPSVPSEFVFARDPKSEYVFRFLSILRKQSGIQQMYSQGLKREKEKRTMALIDMQKSMDLGQNFGASK